MSSFFSNLIDRALERSPVLEPRRPSLFEPDAGQTAPSRFDPAWGLEEQIDEPALEDESKGRGTAPDIPSTPELSSPGRMSSSPATPVDRPHSVDRRSQVEFSLGGLETIVAEQVHRAMRDLERVQSSIQSRTSSRRLADPVADGSAPQSAKQSVGESPRLEVERPPDLDSALEREPRSNLVVIKRELHIEQETNEVNRPDRTGPDGSMPEVPVQSLPHPRVPEPAAVKRARAAPPPVERRVRPALGTVPRAEAASIQAANPPPIQVTVGRVEVRAHGPQTPQAPQPKRAKPNMSLEEYMRARSGESK